MKIAIASDHAGLELKISLIEYLTLLEHTVENFGPFEYNPNDDYPDFAIPACKSVVEHKNDRGVLICTNGIGMCITANRFKGLRGALVYSDSSAQKSRQHDNANVLCLGSHEFTKEQIFTFLDIWLVTEFDGERHARRLDKIDNAS